MRRSRPLLLVEDNPDDVMILQRALKDLGIAEALIHVPDAEQALAYLRTGAHPKPALVLLDLHLPGMSGVEFLKTFGLVRGPSTGTFTSVIGKRPRRASIAARVSRSSASIAMTTSSFSGG